MFCGCRMNLYGSEDEPVATSCQCGNEHSLSINARDFLARCNSHEEPCTLESEEKLRWRHFTRNKNPSYTKQLKKPNFGSKLVIT